MKKTDKMWGGRFKEPTNKMVEAFTASLPFDRRLYRQDIEGSMAHCRVLAKTGYLSPDESRKILKGLRDIRKEFENGTFKLSPDLEDIHMAVEKALIEKTGAAGAKLHAGRSRNDQVSLDVRLYLREEVIEILILLNLLKSGLVARARKEINTVMPGYTHLQKAQPVLLAHYLLAYWEMFSRDEERMVDCFGRINVMPLGSAALAGTGLKMDRAYAAKLLRFPSLSRNSMDAVYRQGFHRGIHFCRQPSHDAPKPDLRRPCPVVQRGVRLRRKYPIPLPREAASCRRRKTPTWRNSSGARRAASTGVL